MTTIPDGLPTLSAGPHPESSGMACVMEYCSVLSGQSWSDTPSCTNWTIARTAQVVNDRLSDEDRHLLVPFIGRLLVAREDTDEINSELVKLVVKLHPDIAARLLDSGDSLHYWFIPEIVGYVMGYGRQGEFPGRDYLPKAGLDYLDSLLSAHEAMTGKAPTPVSPEALSRAKALIESGAGLV